MGDLRLLFPDRPQLRYETLPEGLPEEQLAKTPVKKVLSHHGHFNTRLVRLYYYFGVKQPPLEIDTLISDDEEPHGRVLVGYNILKQLGLVIDVAGERITTANGEELLEAALPKVPARPVTSAEIANAVKNDSATSPQEFRVWMSVDLFGTAEVITWPVLLDTGASIGSNISWMLLSRLFPKCSFSGDYWSLPKELPPHRLATPPTTAVSDASGKPLLVYNINISTILGGMHDFRAVHVMPKRKAALAEFVMGIDQIKHFGMRIDLARNVVLLKNGKEMPLLERDKMPVEVIQRRALKLQEAVTDKRLREEAAAAAAADVEMAKTAEKRAAPHEKEGATKRSRRAKEGEDV